MVALPTVAPAFTGHRRADSLIYIPGNLHNSFISFHGQFNQFVVPVCAGPTAKLRTQAEKVMLPEVACRMGYCIAGVCCLLLQSLRPTRKYKRWLPKHGVAHHALSLSDLRLLPPLLAKVEEHLTTSGPASRLLVLTPASMVFALDSAEPEPQHIEDVPAEAADVIVDTGAVPTVWWSWDPNRALSPKLLASRILTVSRLLRQDGHFFFGCQEGLGSPLHGYMQQVFEVSAVKHHDGAFWVYTCRRPSVPLEPAPFPGVVRVPLGDKGLAVWTRNPAEAALMYREVFIENCYTPDNLVLQWQQKPVLIVDAVANLGLFCLY